GLTTRVPAGTRRPRASPCTNSVLPAPSSPIRPTTRPGRAASPSATPAFAVSSGQVDSSCTTLHYTRMRGLAVVLALLAAAACDRERTTPTIEPLPSAGAASPLRVPGPLSPRIANYRIDARYDAARQRIDATQTLRWRN